VAGEIGGGRGLGGNRYLKQLTGTHLGPGERAKTLVRPCRRKSPKREGEKEWYAKEDLQRLQEEVLFLSRPKEAEHQGNRGISKGVREWGKKKKGLGPVPDAKKG